jgi:hypothetical protein
VTGLFCGPTERVGSDHGLMKSSPQIDRLAMIRAAAERPAIQPLTTVAFRKRRRGLAPIIVPAWSGRHRALPNTSFSVLPTTRTPR